MSLQSDLFKALDDTWRPLRDLRLPVSDNRFLIAPARKLIAAGLVESRLGRSYNLEYRLKPKALTENRKAAG